MHLWAGYYIFWGVFILLTAPIWILRRKAGGANVLVQTLSIGAVEALALFLCWHGWTLWKKAKRLNLAADWRAIMGDKPSPDGTDKDPLAFWLVFACVFVGWFSLPESVREGIMEALHNYHLMHHLSK